MSKSRPTGPLSPQARKLLSKLAHGVPVRRTTTSYFSVNLYTPDGKLSARFTFANVTALINRQFVAVAHVSNGETQWDITEAGRQFVEEKEQVL